MYTLEGRRLFIKKFGTPWEVMQSVLIPHGPTLKLLAPSQGKEDKWAPKNSDIKEPCSSNSTEPCSSVKKSLVAQRQGSHVAQLQKILVT